MTGDISPTIEGLHITGGDNYEGGGLYFNMALDSSSKITLISNTFTANTAGRGGAIALQNYPDTAATLIGNVFISNTASEGGALMAEVGNLTLVNNVFAANSSAYGGGLYLGVSNGTFISNVFDSNVAEHYGGAMFLQALDTVVMMSNTFAHNAASQSGGGLYSIVDTFALNGNTFISNTAGEDGGGAHTASAIATTLNANRFAFNAANSGGGLYLVDTRNAMLTNDVLTDNHADAAGSGFYISGSLAQLLHTTIARNSDGDGSGIYITNYLGESSAVTLTNTVLVSQTVGITATAGNTAILDGVLWYGNGANTGGAGAIAITHEITGDPAFAPDGYHLTARSAAIDQGVDAGVTTDIDGERRPQGPAPDLGADEFQLPLPYPDLTVTKQASPDPVQTGSQLTYTLRVTNTGNVNLHATITDALPTHVTSGKTSGGTALLPGQPFTWTALIPTSGIWTETVVVTVETGYAGPLTNVVEVTTEEGASGIYTVTSQVQGTPALEVTKQASSNLVHAGSQLTYTLYVTNTGNVDLHAVITDTLPVHVTPGGFLFWAPTIAAPGGVWSQTIVVAVEMGYAGPLTNTVEVATREGAASMDSVTVSVVNYQLYLPLVLRQSP